MVIASGQGGGGRGDTCYLYTNQSAHAIFNVAHILASCGAVDRSAICDFMENSVTIALPWTYSPDCPRHPGDADGINAVGHPDPDAED